MKSLKYSVETKIFGVCTYLGELLKMPKKNIRLFFVYLSFVTVGSPIIIYLILAFWFKMNDYIHSERQAVWDL
jgi:phage shock protein PspC (stress-responsive transcriptional regulator)